MIAPYVTFIVPILNAEKYLEKCLKSIRKQDYKKNRYEIIVVDGGSDDDSIKIAKKYKAKILINKQKDAESGKAVGIRASRGEVIALLDADNEIINKNWLTKMVKPLTLNPGLFGVESHYFPSGNESIFNTYSMILHIADPFSRCIASSLKKIIHKEYVEYIIPYEGSYPLGANGFLWRKKVIDEVGGNRKMFEESNFSHLAKKMGHRRFARVPGIGIYHYHIDSLQDFIKKRLKIGGKFLNRRNEKKRTWIEGVSKAKFVFCIIYCITFVGPLIEGIYESIRTKQKAWLLHPFLSFISVSSYGIAIVWRKMRRI